jgi:hypothetical protein
MDIDSMTARWQNLPLARFARVKDHRKERPDHLPWTTDVVRARGGFVCSTLCIDRSRRELPANARKSPKRPRMNVE